MNISKEEKDFLLEEAKNTLFFAVHNRHYNASEEFSSNNLKTNSSVFISMYKNGILRSRSGYTFAIMSLHQTVIEMTLASVIGNSIYAPINKNEFEDLELEISVLSSPHKIESLDEFEVGKHGVSIDYNSNSCMFLPQVSLEKKWNKNETLLNLSLKVGLEKYDITNSDIKLKIFEVNILKI